ncbi:hypothetical protein CAL29_23740 [Bordetella genomosp. 10]|uniref:Uncharacterized protein n=1 Tax=Bordetella genomosp. 10 TaxID=1416804 RepID=A0A261S0U0_9BORD|nr:hypothetical protein CAL29_23740 [Bordetella genomosp. 10]
MRTQSPTDRVKPLTVTQESILDALRQARRPLTAYALLECVPVGGPPQIYRALDKLMSRGLVRRVETLKAYVWCENTSLGLGCCALAICRSCGHVDVLVDDTLGTCVGDWLGRVNFSADKAAIEVLGLCAACSTISGT